jgi:hypothetical protein
LQPHCKGCCNHLYFHQVATTSSKHHPSRNLTVSWHGAFFELVYCNRTFFLVFCNRNDTAIRVQSHCDKVATTHILVCNCLFCNRSTSVVATTV